METKINFLKEFRGISIYRDPYTSPDSILLGRKGKEVENTGIVYVPNENFKDIKPVPFEKKEVEKILKESVEKINFSDYTFLICNVPDEKLHLIEEFITKKLDG